MENTPTIILFWFFIIAVFMLMLITMITAIILLSIKKGKEQSANGMRLVGKICLTLSIICSVPIFLVVGYIVYIYMG